MLVEQVVFAASSDQTPFKKLISEFPQRRFAIALHVVLAVLWWNARALYFKDGDREDPITCWKCTMFGRFCQKHWQHCCFGLYCYCVLYCVVNKLFSLSFGRLNLLDVLCYVGLHAFKYF